MGGFLARLSFLSMHLQLIPQPDAPIQPHHAQVLRDPSSTCCTPFLHALLQRFVHPVPYARGGQQQFFVHASSFSTLTPQQSNTSLETMELCVQGYDDETKFVIEVGEKDTTETMRQKVATATGLCEDSFRMGFGGKEEGEDITELSAGDTVVLTKTTKYQSVEALRALGETDISEARLATVKDPEVASLLLQAEVATVIPAGFLSQASFTRLDLSAVSGVTRIEDNFLYGCASVKTVDLSGLCNVTHIGDAFLLGSTSLTSLDVSGFTAVTVIPKAFLHESGVTELDLSAMTSVTTVGTYFLLNCKSLQSLNISEWRRVTHIANGFLWNCTSLTTIDLSAFCSVTKIGSDFLRNCTSLTTISFSGMTNVTELTDGFCRYCTSLTTIDLSAFCSVTKIGCDFLFNCSSLTTISFSGMTNVTKVGNSFCRACTSLATIDLSALHRVLKVEYDFLMGCTSLTSIDLSAFGSARGIGHSFLSQCSSLKTVDLSVLCSITRIESGWMQGCSALTTADLSGLSNVKNINTRFLQGCTSLTTLDMSGIGSDTMIQHNFLDNCNALTTIVLPGSIDIHEMSLPNEAQKNHGTGLTKTFDACVRDIYARFTEQFGGVRTEDVVRADVSGDARQCIALRRRFDASTRGRGQAGTGRQTGALQARAFGGLGSGTGCSDVVSSTVRNGQQRKSVVEARPKRSAHHRRIPASGRDEHAE